MAKLPRDLHPSSRRSRLLVALFVLGTCVASAALPQDYPSRPIRMIVPFPAGGTPGQFAEFMRTELVKWGKIVRESGARVE